MKAYELLSSPEKWTTLVNAKDINGKPIDTHNPDACSFCIYGAIYKCYVVGNDEIQIERIREVLYPRPIANWNDTHTYEEVHSLLKRLDI